MRGNEQWNASISRSCTSWYAGQTRNSMFPACFSLKSIAWQRVIGGVPCSRKGNGDRSSPHNRHEDGLDKHGGQRKREDIGTNPSKKIEVWRCVMSHVFREIRLSVSFQSVCFHCKKVLDFDDRKYENLRIRSAYYCEKCMYKFKSPNRNNPVILL